MGEMPLLLYSHGSSAVAALSDYGFNPQRETGCNLSFISPSNENTDEWTWLDNLAADNNQGVLLNIPFLAGDGRIAGRASWWKNSRTARKGLLWGYGAGPDEINWAATIALQKGLDHTKYSPESMAQVAQEIRSVDASRPTWLNVAADFGNAPYDCVDYLRLDGATFLSGDYYPFRAAPSCRANSIGELTSLVNRFAARYEALGSPATHRLGWIIQAFYYSACNMPMIDSAKMAQQWAICRNRSTAFEICGLYALKEYSGYHEDMIDMPEIRPEARTFCNTVRNTAVLYSTDATEWPDPGPNPNPTPDPTPGVLTPSTISAVLNWETSVTSTKQVVSAVSRNNAIAEVGGIYNNGLTFTVNTGANSGSTMIDVTFADNTTATLGVTAQTGTPTPTPTPPPAPAPSSVTLEYKLNVDGEVFTGIMNLTEVV